MEDSPVNDAIFSRKMATAIKTVSECSTMEELIELFNYKISNIQQGIELRTLDYNVCVSFRSLESDINELEILLGRLRMEIESGQEQLKEMQDLRTRIGEIGKDVDHALENFPDTLQKHNEPVSQKADLCTNKEKPAVVSQSLPQQQKGIRRIPTVMPLSLSEFENIPKYMKGRLTYDNINNYISCFNKTVQDKYKFLSTPRSQLAPAEFKKVQEMRSQETPDTRGLCFCVSQDLKNYGNFKTEKDIKTIMTILRHCSRMKEVRGPGPIVRFVVIDCGL